MASFSPGRPLWLLALLYTACPATTPASQSAASLTADTSQTNNSTTDFTLSDVDGKSVHLSDYNGQVVLLDFWATWCIPCEAEIPHLEKMYLEHKQEGFVVLAIAMDGPETVANVAPFARRYNLTIPVLLDEETRVVAIYNPKRTAPLSVLIDRKGKIARVRQGFNAGDEQLVEADVKQALAAK